MKQKTAIRLATLFIDDIILHINIKTAESQSSFAGRAKKIVLLSFDRKALFVWRKFRSMDNQKGINCMVFRNETKHRSSLMILEAEKWAVKKWGATRVYTYVNPRKIKSQNPGFCFKKAGWRVCGITKARKLLILEKFLKYNTKHNTLHYNPHDPSSHISEKKSNCLCSFFKTYFSQGNPFSKHIIFYIRF